MAASLIRRMREHDWLGALIGSGLRSDILRHRPEYRPQVRGLTPWPVQEYIWTHCFRQGAGVSQDLLDCESPIPESEATAILDGYHKSDSLLANLRVWMSTLRISRIIVTGMQRRIGARGRLRHDAGRCSCTCHGSEIGFLGFRYRAHPYERTLPESPVLGRHS